MRVVLPHPTLHRSGASPSLASRTGQAILSSAVNHGKATIPRGTTEISSFRPLRVVLADPVGLAAVMAVLGLLQLEKICEPSRRDYRNTLDRNHVA